MVKVQALKFTDLNVSNLNSAEQSFALQYTSVIIIVLAFIIGSFVKPFLPPAEKEAKQVFVSVDLADLKYDNLFFNSSAKLKTNESEALAKFATAHDLNFNIQVYADNNNSEAESTTISLARSIELYRFLLKQGVPYDAMHIIANTNKSEYQVAIKISKLTERVE
jgi:hypothetical protein